MSMIGAAVAALDRLETIVPAVRELRLAGLHCVALQCMTWNHSSQFAYRTTFREPWSGPVGSLAAKYLTSFAQRYENI